MDKWFISKYRPREIIYIINIMRQVNYYKKKQNLNNPDAEKCLNAEKSKPNKV